MDTNRLEAFSDGVFAICASQQRFAIAITLLVLEIKESAASRHSARGGTPPSLAVLPRLRSELPGDRRNLDQPPRDVPTHCPRRRNAVAA